MVSDFDVVVTEPPGLSVDVTESPSPRVEVNLTGQGSPGVVEIRVPGPAGPPGPPGTLIAGTGDKHYVHVQSNPATQWTVNHGLGKYPSTTVVDSAGSVVEGDVNYIDLNTLTFNASAPFGGSLYCN